MQVETAGAKKLNISENCLKVLEKRYLKKDTKGKVIETPEQMFTRVASYIASADKSHGATDKEIKKTEENFYNMMTNFEFMPNSPTLMNAGRDMGQLSACFVLPIEDSMESIFEAVKNTALIHRSGGGTGFSFSRLRPKNSMVRSTGGISSGPVSFMKVFNAATQAVKQGGMRRGANMGILRIDHPDILEFIKCKEEDKEINNFNISVTVTEDFMNKVIEDKEYDLIDPHTKEATGRLKAKEVFGLIVEMAWKNGEPGIVFIDRMNQFNPTPNLGQYESTNPCGEQILLPFESCNLGSINLSKVVTGDGKKEIDWGKLKRLVHLGVHFLDNVIDMNKFPLPEIEEMTKKNRKIGLGVMGWADMLIQLEVPYDTDEAVELAEKIMSFIDEEVRAMSRELAEKRVSFPSFNESVFSDSEKRRNATLTTIAPTGTISIISNASSGIEPLFALSYYRNVMDNDKLIEVNPLFEEIAKKEGFYSRGLMETITGKGSIKDIAEVPEKYKRIFVTSHDIAPIWHIRMQAAFQKHTDNAVSKTVNFHNEATRDDVREVYMLAYKLGCKGVTIYRDRSREEQVLNINVKTDTNTQTAGPEAKSKVVIPKPRPTVTRGTTTKVTTGCGNLYITINVDDRGMPFEVFIQMGKAGGCAASQLEAVGRLVSLALRSDIENKKIIDQLRGIRCPSPSWEKGGRIFSCADAIARVLELRLGNGKMHHKKEVLERHSPHTMIEDKLGNVVGVCLIAALRSGTRKAVLSVALVAIPSVKVMSIRPDAWIKKMALEYDMIKPFEPKQVKNNNISYGLSSYGYDIRIADEFKIFKGVVGKDTIDPKNINPDLFENFQGENCVIPSNSFILARSLEYFKIPRNILVLCAGKSTYARIGVVVNITPLEPSWEGFITISISNTSPCAVRLYANEGIGQIVFFESTEACDISYSDRKGRYQSQKTITLPK